MKSSPVQTRTSVLPLQELAIRRVLPALGVKLHYRRLFFSKTCVR